MMCLYACRRIVAILVLMLAFGVCIAPSAGAAGQNIAVLFSGGWDVDNNHDRYYEETLRMWNDTVYTLGFGVKNVYVLFADGTNPAVDRSSGMNSDWSQVLNAGGHVYPATHDDLRSIMVGLQPRIMPDTSFYFWSFDHGNDTPHAETLNGWDHTTISDHEFAGWADPYNGRTECYAFAQCYAQGMVNEPDDLDFGRHPRRFASWASAWFERSSGRSWADAWADGIESGLTTTYALGEYARYNDAYGPSGNWWETPGWCGANFSIITGRLVPEPGSLIALGMGLIGLAGMIVRRRR